MDVDTVLERARQSRTIFSDLMRRAGAFPRAVSVIPARTGVHCGDQHEARGVSEGSTDPGEGHRAVFERLPKAVQDGATKFWRLIEEQHAVVGQRNLAGTRDGASSDEPCV